MDKKESVSGMCIPSCSDCVEIDRGCNVAPSVDMEVNEDSEVAQVASPPCTGSS